MPDSLTHASASDQQKAAAPRLRHVYCATVFCFLALLFIFRFHADTGFTSLIRFGDQWENRRVPALHGLSYYVIPHHSGYDGQFYAQLALTPRLDDPVLTTCIDGPFYRARRIFLPWLSYLLGFGQPPLSLHLYSLLNPASWLFLAWWLLRRWPPTSWENFARWFACVMSMGVLESVRASLTDLPALCCLVVALDLFERGHRRWAAAILACGGLIRETTALGSAALFLPASPKLRLWFQAGCWLTLSILPLALWVLYLRQVFPQADAGTAHNFAWPFQSLGQGLLESLDKLSHGIEDRGRFTGRLLAILALLTQAIYLLTHPQGKTAWWRVGTAYALLLPFLGPAVWDGYWAVCRSVLPMTIAFVLLLTPSRWFWPLLILGSLPTAHALFRLAY